MWCLFLFICYLPFVVVVLCAQNEESEDDKQKQTEPQQFVVKSVS